MTCLQSIAGRVPRLSVPPVRPSCCHAVTTRGKCTVLLRVTPASDRWHSRCAIVCRAAMLDTATEDSPSEQADEPSTPFGLPLPSVRHQRPLDTKAIKLLRTEVNTAARNKELINVQVGQHGITQTFLAACMDVFNKRQFVRVRLGEGCGLERGEAAEALEKLLDCVCVHQIGYTVSLYRQLGLPRPSNCPANNQPTDVQGEGTAGAEAAGEEATETAAAAVGQLGAVSGKKPKDKRKKVRPPRSKQDQEARPIEFEVL